MASLTSDIHRDESLKEKIHEMLVQSTNSIKGTSFNRQSFSNSLGAQEIEAKILRQL